MADTIDLDSFRARRPQLFRSPEAMAALRTAEHVADQLASTGQPLILGPALDRLCAAVPPEPQEERLPAYRPPAIDLQAVRESLQVMPARPYRMSGWTTIALLVLVATPFAIGILRSLGQ